MANRCFQFVRECTPVSNDHEEEEEDKKADKEGEERRNYQDPEEALLAWTEGCSRWRN